MTKFNRPIVAILTIAVALIAASVAFAAEKPAHRDLSNLEKSGTMTFEVKSVKLINDRYTGKPRGFAFVEMDDESAETAISATDGMEFEGRNLKVNLAKPRGVWRMRRPRH